MSPPDAQGASVPDREEQPVLACYRCRDRKIKCDRSRPACRMCVKSTSSPCTYPASAQKPGPKQGAPQRRRARPTRYGSVSDPSKPDSPGLFAERSVGFSVASNQRFDERASELPSGDRGPTNFPDSAYRDARSTIFDLTAETRTSSSRALAVSNLLHPTHEPPQQSTSDAELQESNWNGQDQIQHRVDASCAKFGISEHVYRSLLTSYFENIKFFSLFHRPTFEAKLAAIPTLLQFQALIASMFALSARFNHPSEVSVNAPSSGHFYNLGSKLFEEALKVCGDSAPPLCLLQALILLTFTQLADGVRGRAWRAVGSCVSIAYELQLHLIDKDSGDHRSDIHVTVNEEARRAWWTVWEFDVLASTIRRLPTGINWGRNQTMLPISDDQWFAKSASGSCLLHPDPAKAWKLLEASGNRSSKAWFIVTNALMRSAHLLSSSQFYPSSSPSQHLTDASPRPQNDCLDVLANSLYCLVSAMPCELSYRGEYLYFSSCPSNSSGIQSDEAKYSIHIMVQLSKFMIYHQNLSSAVRYVEGGDDRGGLGGESGGLLEPSSWSHYLAAANEIITVVRNSMQQHFRFVNPFLANTIWLAAAAQLVAKSFDPPLIDSRLAESNLELLKINLKGYAEFWGLSTVLQQKLGMLGRGLEGIKPKGRQDVAGPSRFRTGFSNDADLLGIRKPDDLKSQSQKTTQQYNPWGAQEHPVRSNADTFDSGTDISTHALDVGPTLDEDIPPESWGWGLDDLLNYGGFEYP